MRRLKNTTSSSLFHNNSGVGLAVGYNDVNDVDFPRMDDSQMLGWFNDGSIVFNDGSEDFTDPADGWSRFRGTGFDILNDVGVKKQPGVFDPNGLRARLVGIQNTTVSGGSTQNLDWKIPDLTWGGASKQTYFDGVEWYAGSAKLGDTVSFQVVDVDGIQYPAGTVVEEFAKNLGAIPDKKDTLRLYKAKLIVGFYVRVIYKSTGTPDVSIIVNLVRHLDENKDL